MILFSSTNQNYCGLVRFWLLTAGFAVVAAVLNFTQLTIRWIEIYYIPIYILHVMYPYYVVHKPWVRLYTIVQ